MKAIQSIICIGLNYADHIGEVRGTDDNLGQCKYCLLFKESK